MVTLSEVEALALQLPAADRAKLAAEMLDSLSPSFPYHFLYQERSWGIKVTVVRHHRRHPRDGLRRG
jgi:hypothetical protein